MLDFTGFVTYNISTCGSSSVVEHDLAKVGVAGSNPVSRFFIFRRISW